MRLEEVDLISPFGFLSCGDGLAFKWWSGVEWLSYLISGLGVRLVDSVRAD